MKQFWRKHQKLFTLNQFLKRFHKDLSQQWDFIVHFSYKSNAPAQGTKAHTADLNATTPEINFSDSPMKTKIENNWKQTIDFEMIVIYNWELACRTNIMVFDQLNVRY